MTVDRTLPRAELVKLTDADLRHLERTTSRLADETHRQAIRYQHQVDRMRKEQRARLRNRRASL